MLVEDFDGSCWVLLNSKKWILHWYNALVLRVDYKAVLAPLEQVVHCHKIDIWNSSRSKKLCNCSKLILVHSTLSDVNVTNKLSIVAAVDLHYVETICEKYHWLDIAPEGDPKVSYREAHSKVGPNEVCFDFPYSFFHCLNSFPLIKHNSIAYLKGKLKSCCTVFKHFRGIQLGISHLCYVVDEAIDSSKSLHDSTCQ